jgi:excisionase family DNA binding protein
MGVPSLPTWIRAADNHTLTIAPHRCPDHSTGHGAMVGLSLREAAGQAGTSKSTILRAIQSGRLSATRTDDGGYSIAPAELFRVYPAKSSGVAEERSTDQSVGQDASLSATPDATDLRIRNAELEAQITALKAILEAEKKRADEIREDRDRWAAQAERLALPAPARRGWRWFRGAG